MPKKEKLSENAEYKRLKHQMAILDTMEMPSPATVKDNIPFDFAAAMYKTDSGEIVSALNRYKKLIAVPREIRNDDNEIIYDGWCYEKHLLIKNISFVNHAVFCEYKMCVARLTAAFYLKKEKWWVKKLAIAKAMVELMKHRKTHKKIKEAAALKKALAELGGN